MVSNFEEICRHHFECCIAASDVLLKQTEKNSKPHRMNVFRSRRAPHKVFCAFFTKHVLSLLVAKVGHWYTVSQTPRPIHSWREKCPSTLISTDSKRAVVCDVRLTFAECLSGFIVAFRRCFMVSSFEDIYQHDFECCTIASADVLSERRKHETTGIRFAGDVHPIGFVCFLPEMCAVTTWCNLRVRCTVFHVDWCIRRYAKTPRGPGPEVEGSVVLYTMSRPTQYFLWKQRGAQRPWFIAERCGFALETGAHKLCVAVFFASFKMNYIVRHRSFKRSVVLSVDSPLK